MFTGFELQINLHIFKFSCCKPARLWVECIWSALTGFNVIPFLELIDFLSDRPTLTHIWTSFSKMLAFVLHSFCKTECFWFRLVFHYQLHLLKLHAVNYVFSFVLKCLELPTSWNASVALPASLTESTDILFASLLHLTTIMFLKVL